MFKYPAYPEYRDSGAQWLGDIPVDWSLFDSKRIFKSRRELSLDTDDQLAASQKYGVVPQSLMMKLNNAKVMLALKGTNSFRHVEKDDFVISLRSFEGGIEHSKYTGCVSPAYTVLFNTKDIIPSFYRYLFKSSHFIAALQSTTDSLRDGKSITFEQFGAIPLVFPRLSDQEKIANFLDNETARIDTLIKKKIRFIELLKEKRQALISHTVTKGLDLDAEMKGSGIDWLGVMPSHWHVTKIKHTAELTPKKINIDRSMTCSFVPMEKLRTDRLILDEIRNVDDVCDGYTYFADEDILMAKVTPCFENKNIAIAKGLTNKIGFGSSEIYALRANKEVSNRFLFYRMQEDVFMGIAIGEMTGTAGLKRVPSKVISNFTYGIPTLGEQKEIVNFLDRETVRIKALITKAEESISLLKEHRTALISAAVTGKIDVRNHIKNKNNTEVA